MPTIKVLIVEDHAVVREGLKILIRTEPEFEIAGEADNGAQAVELTKRLHPDVVVMVADASALERNLYLLTELLLLPVPVVLALNMMDVAAAHGTHVEPHVLEAALGLPVVPVVATRNQGVVELV